VKGKRGRPKRGKALNLLDRFWYRYEEVLGFLYHDLPFDNNEAERDLRMMKTKQKISGCFRNKDNADWFANLRSVITSARKKAVNILQILSLTIQDPQKATQKLLSS
jgi:transposase